MDSRQVHVKQPLQGCWLWSPLASRSSKAGQEMAVRKKIKNPVCVGETTKLMYFSIFLKLWRAVYPSNKAPIGAKLCENAFQTIPVNSIFGEQKKLVDEIFRSRTSFFASFGQFWRIWRLTDLKINFLALFCFRCTYSGVCTTKNRPSTIM